MADDVDVKPDIGAERRWCRIDGKIAALAERQHGIVARAQLAVLGIGRRAIGHRLESGRLHILYRGVYSVGHRVVSREGRWMAAVLAIGPDAVLSHRSAAALLGDARDRSRAHRGDRATEPPDSAGHPSPRRATPGR
jgi:hypothetical protein